MRLSWETLAGEKGCAFLALRPPLPLLSIDLSGSFTMHGKQGVPDDGQGGGYGDEAPRGRHIPKHYLVLMNSKKWKSQ